MQGQIIFSSSDRLCGPLSLLSSGYRGLFPRGKAARAWSWPQLYLEAISRIFSALSATCPVHLHNKVFRYHLAFYAHSSLWNSYPNVESSVSHWTHRSLINENVGFFNSPLRPDRLWIQPRLLLFLRDKSGRSDTSCPSTSRVETTWSYISTPLYVCMAWYLVNIWSSLEVTDTSNNFKSLRVTRFIPKLTC
jgi:hypothetical protein